MNKKRDVFLSINGGLQRNIEYDFQKDEWRFFFDKNTIL